MKISTCPPSPLLSRFISCYWTLENSSRSHVELVYPTGKIQLLFHYGSSFVSRDYSGRETKQPGFALCGQRTSWSNVTALPSSGMIGAVLHPHTASVFFPFPLNEVNDSTVDLTDIYPGWKSFKDRFLSAGSNALRIGIIEEYLASKICLDDPLRLSMLKSCIADISAAKGTEPVHLLSDRYDMTERTLERIFSRHVGLSPKQFSHIIKLNHAIDLCRGCGEPHGNRLQSRLLRPVALHPIDKTLYRSFPPAAESLPVERGLSDLFLFKMSAFYNQKFLYRYIPDL
jgi:hypothetical protein